MAGVCDVEVMGGLVDCDREATVVGGGWGEGFGGSFEPGELAVMFRFSVAKAFDQVAVFIELVDYRMSAIGDIYVASRVVDAMERCSPPNDSLGVLVPFQRSGSSS